MKFLLTTLLLLTAAQKSLAAELICNPLQKETVLAAKVGAEETVYVYGRETASNGYHWTSAQNIESQIVRDTVNPEPGAYHLVSFEIPVNKSARQTKTVYTFNYKRSWENKPPVSVCKVTIIRRPIVR